MHKNKHTLSLYFAIFYFAYGIGIGLGLWEASERGFHFEQIGCLIPVINVLVFYFIFATEEPELIILVKIGAFLTALIWIIEVVYNSYREENARKRQARLDAEQKIRDKEAKLAEQQALHRANIDNLWALNKNGVTLYERAPVHLQKAADYLKTAETDLSDKVYAPFWEAIEGAASNLALFNSDVKKLSWVSKEFSKRYTDYAESVSPFPITPEDIDALIVAETVSNSMSAIVREAHKDPNYSTLYEQRRTTAAVIEGFANLQEAINGMKEEILSSISRMQASMERSFEHLQTSVDGLSENIGSQQEAFVRAQSDYMKQQETANREERKRFSRQYDESIMLRKTVEETRNTLKNMHAGIPPVFGWD